MQPYWEAARLPLWKLGHPLDPRSVLNVPLGLLLLSLASLAVSPALKTFNLDEETKRNV